MTQAPPTSTHLSDALQAVQHREVEGAIPKGGISEDTETQSVFPFLFLQHTRTHLGPAEPKIPSTGSQSVEASPGKLCSSQET